MDRSHGTNNLVSLYFSQAAALNKLQSSKPLFSSKNHFTGRYNVRPLGGSLLSSKKLPPISQAAPSQKLLSGLLQANREQVLFLLDRLDDSTWVDPFYNEAYGCGIAALVYDSIIKLDLPPAFEKWKLSNGASFLQTLKSEASLSAVQSARFNTLFLTLLESLGEFKDSLIWIKGIVLCRTLYEHNYHRLSQDFDVIVDEKQANAVLQRLQATGFEPVWDNPGACHQAGVGPVGSLSALSLSPHKDFEPCHNLVLTQEGWPHLELKFDPLERGLSMQELTRFFSCAPTLTWQDHKFKHPDDIDHLLLSLAHLHKHGFDGWQWLYDIHLLAKELAKDNNLWSEFLRRCHAEKLEASAWAGLDLARDRLNTPVPEAVLAELAPAHDCPVSRGVTFTVSTDFVWNENSLPSLWLNACFLGDRDHKLSVLSASFFPSRQFLARYYLGAKELKWWQYLPSLILHWLVLILPAGAVRRTFGRLVWQSGTDRKQK